MMTKSDRNKWWEDHPDAHPIVEERTSAIICRPLGISILADDIPATTLKAIAVSGSHESDSSDE
ncbi:MAG: hypothetical protein ACKPKO_11590, partial [Candidatus Fonsibacter sp.]